MTDKIIDSIELSEWEIETDTGWKPISHIHKTIEFVVYKLILEDELYIECADTHIVFDSMYNEVFVKDIKIGDYIKTKFGDKRCIDLIKYDYQEHMYDVTVDDDNHRFYSNDILSHNTTTQVGWLLWYILFNADKNCGILANKAKTANMILGRLKLAYELLPQWLQNGVVEWNKTSIELENGSKVFASATSASGIRGDSLSVLILDEFALVPNNIANDFWASVWPTISSGTETKVIVSSTPKGYNLFWKIWSEAEEGLNGFSTFQMNWWEIPGRDENWLNDQRKILGENIFNAEVLCQFSGSTNTLVSSEIINCQPIIKPIEETENIKIYEKPIPGHAYISIVDTARGVEGDYSVIITLDVTEIPYKVVCVYRDNSISPYAFPQIIYQIATEYNESYVLAELNDAGGEVANILYRTYEYVNMFFSTRKEELSHSNGKTKEIGLRTTSKVKMLGCSVLNTILKNQQLVVCDSEIISEIGTFVKKGTSYAADTGYHDDLVMCLVLFSWLTQQKIFKNLTNVDTRSLIFENQMQEIKQSLLPFGFSNGSLAITSGLLEESTKTISSDDWLFQESNRVGYNGSE